MRRYFLTLLAIFIAVCLPALADAKPHTLEWTWPTQNCDATALLASDFIAAEIAYDVNPMPMPSDTLGPCDLTQPDPDAPVAATVVAVDLLTTSHTLNLMPGMTYYARIRLSAYVAGNWSAWSVETQFTVPYGRPGRTKIK
jgi:hypothetical protein